MKGLLKFVVCGSVDDGKSTLIGHMLYDAKLIYADQKRALELDSRLGSVRGELDYSLLLDGLMAEREQGITIDVAYRYFSTKYRSFIVADAPGHEEYTRNMAVGAAFADLAVILVDVTQGILPQTRRHAKIFDMDITSMVVIPVSATAGDNINSISKHMSWYADSEGCALLPYLESVDVNGSRDGSGFLLPIQRVSRPNSSFRGFQGEVAAGRISLGDEIIVLPSREKATVSRIFVAGEEREEAREGQSVSLCLSREVDVSRGCVLAQHKDLEVGSMFVADILWMDDERLAAGRQFWCKLGTKMTPATVLRIKYCLDVQTGKRLAANNLEKNGIGTCEISLSEKTVFSPFEENHTLGGFILIDRVTYNTAACGMIRHGLRREHNLTWQMTDINREIRATDLGQQPKTLWFTGLSGSGKSTLANGLEKALRARGLHTMLLDGDNVRMGLNRNLGFTEQDRVENIRRIAEVAKLMNDAGLIVLTAVISPYLADRQHAREIIGESDFIEIYVKTSLEICESRDVKGLYKKARQGFILNFTGVSAPYEPPLKPEIVIDTEGRRLEESLAELLKAWDIYMETQYGCI